MATVQITYNCGCGFSTKSQDEAVVHANTTKHTLTVHGLIKKPEAK